jgi:hypothetical protein
MQNVPVKIINRSPRLERPAKLCDPGAVLGNNSAAIFSQVINE